MWAGVGVVVSSSSCIVLRQVHKVTLSLVVFSAAAHRNASSFCEAGMRLTGGIVAVGIGNNSIPTCTHKRHIKTRQKLRLTKKT